MAFSLPDLPYAYDALEVSAHESKPAFQSPLKNQGFCTVVNRVQCPLKSRPPEYAHPPSPHVYSLLWTPKP
jgi:hypothetical protein